MGLDGWLGELVGLVARLGHSEHCGGCWVSWFSNVNVNAG